MKQLVLVLLLTGCAGAPLPDLPLDGYRAVSSRFNRELAGRFPFGSLETPEASLKTAGAFFHDYESSRAAIAKEISASSRATPEIRRFIAQLDEVADFFRAGTIRIDVTFGGRPDESRGTDQIIEWRLSSSSGVASFPSGRHSVDWKFGDPLLLELTWADRSLWRPATAPAILDLAADGATASFRGSGDWALLRLMQAHVPSPSPADSPTRQWVELTVPIRSSDAAGEARAYVGLACLGRDLETGEAVALKIPSSFPRTAPQT